MKRAAYFLFTYFFVYSSLQASVVEGLRFEYITTKDGLSHNTVRYIMQDNQGFLWISTLNGLNRYDGHQYLSLHPEFSTLSLSENNIRQTRKDDHGRLWIQSTSRVVNCYDTHIESFVDYTGKDENRNYHKINLLPDGDVWLWGLENGVCRIQNVDNKIVSTLYDIDNIGTNCIAFVLKDSSGQVWIGTDKGLLQLVNQIPRFCYTGSKTYIYHSVVEQKDRIYFFTNNDSIVVFDKHRKVFLPTISLSDWREFNINSTVALDEDHILITGKKTSLILKTATSEIVPAHSLFNGETLLDASIIVDNKENVWVHNKTGHLWQYRKDTGKFAMHRLIPPSIMTLIDMERFDIFTDSRGISWITTYGNGLFAIEPGGQISHLTTANSSMKTNYLLSVSEDRMGNLWIGTENTGIIKASLARYNNTIFIPDPKKTGDSDRAIRSILENSETGDVWMGTKSGLVYVFDENLKHKQTFPLHQGAAYAITPDKEGNVWIGTKGNGILVIPKGARRLSECHTHLLSHDRKSVANNIYTILCDYKGRMWVGTLGDGLYVYEFKNGNFQSQQFPILSAKQKQVRHLIQDHTGHIWAGGGNGVVYFEPDSLLTDDSCFEWFHFDKNNPNSMNNNNVKTIVEDSFHKVWIGTSGGGLNLAIKHPSTGKVEFKHYTSEKGLINNMIQAMIEDDNQHLWISTESGISKFNLTSELFENFNFPDTYENDYFSEAAAFKRKNADLLFGSYNGMYIFNPATFEVYSDSHPVSLTGLSVNGIPVRPNTIDSPLKESITQTKIIRLKNSQNSFSIAFSSLNFQGSHANRYTYILENYDNHWNPITPYNIATYKNIPAGKYLFRVKNANHPHSTQRDTLLEIIVIPPFWKSPQALALYFILFVILAFFAIKLMIKMNRLNNEVVIEKQMTEYRLRFFTNISHEFRTPLTIIRGSIENMSQSAQLSPPLKKQLKTLEKSSGKLMRLIDQLLEFRKMQNEQMDLRLEETEVVGFLRGIYDLFQETAERKQIQFVFSANCEIRHILLDRGKIEKVTFNLLSNAFKHTPEKGNVTLSIHVDEVAQRFVLQVSDSGIGIPPDKQHLLFMRFQQINYSTSGIGIGLHLTAELTHIHKGEIAYSDSEWGGACFTVTIPTNQQSYDPKDIVEAQEVMADDNPAITIDEEVEQQEITADNNLITKKYNILLIEDDEEIQQFLKEQLSEYFTVSTASNGLLGWEAANNNQPNLIVCDVMMPEMDGFEVTRKIKSDFQTSHIPIILLTAHSSIEHQLEGINAGADAYIIKPFSTVYLISRIIKLIEQRERLQYKFAHEPGASAMQTTICTTNRDNEFLKKIHEIIEEHIDDPDFAIDDFAQAAFMGRTLFYKKIKGLTNYSPNEYLRIVRLKKAAEFLKNTDLNISEIAYKIGFNDPDYFSKCFKDLFGMRPTQFRHH